jgi:type II secretory pathway component PulK
MTTINPNNRGSALVFALAVLGVLLATGFTMYNFVDLENRSMQEDFHADRAMWVAKSGVEQAIAEIQTAIASGQIDALLTNGLAPVEVPVYHLASKDLNAGASTPVPDSGYSSSATVTISDESARMNLNFAPPAVLMAILKIDGEKARQVREKLPRLDGAVDSADGNSRRWLSSVDDLAGLQLVPAETVAEHRDDLTVFSAMDITNPAGFVNLNTASGPVIEAALGVSPEVAAKVIAARPLTSLEAVTAAAGKDANGFNFKASADSPGGLPKELAFSSRCFRISSSAELISKGQGKSIGVATVQAVVQFPENAAPRIVYWSEEPTGATTKK